MDQSSIDYLHQLLLPVVFHPQIDWAIFDYIDHVPNWPMNKPNRLIKHSAPKVLQWFSSIENNIDMKHHPKHQHMDFVHMMKSCIPPR